MFFFSPWKEGKILDFTATQFINEGWKRRVVSKLCVAIFSHVIQPQVLLPQTVLKTANQMKIALIKRRIL